MTKVVKKKVTNVSNPYGDNAVILNGQPVNPQIMQGNSYELRKQRIDLYQRVTKTLNIDYDPKLLKPYLE